MTTLTRVCSIALLFFTLAGFSQDDATPDVVRTLEAKRIAESPMIDGILESSIWGQAVPSENFVQHQPAFGVDPSQPTVVWVLYDDQALYIGAVMKEVSRDSVLKQLSIRDDFGNTDWFGMVIDTYNSGLNGNTFAVSAAGVQLDEQFSDDEPNESWNAVWQSAVIVNDSGWVAEMKIPYSALRFAEAEEYTWSVNFARELRRLRERSWWNPVDPNQDGFLRQCGKLTGIKGIKPPVRLMFYPYVSTYVEHFPREGASNWVDNYNGGMDLKYGINDAFTLDMTLVPDFNQVRSDNQVLNLSPFEVRFNENRQFFTEGTELFEKGGLFYSRRIGGRPFLLSDAENGLAEDEKLSEVPTTSRLLNATKVSGRTSDGLGIGVFNAITTEEKAIATNGEGATREVLVDPLTNYSVIVFDQLLKNNSSISLINTNVLRAGSTYDANVTGARAAIFNKERSLSFSGGGAVTQKYLSDSVGLGHQYDVSIAKVNGKWNYGLDYNEESDTYDPNDLGFLFNNNERWTGAWIRYRKTQPFGKFNRGNIYASVSRSELYAPNTFSDFRINVESFAVLRSNHGFGLWTALEPIQTYDYFEARESGRFYAYPTNYNFGGWVSTDFSKRFAFEIDLSHRSFNEEGRTYTNYRFEPRYRVNDKLSFVYGFIRDDFRNDIGWVATEGDPINFGRRDRDVHIQYLLAEYIFTNKMGLTFRARHYWAKVAYNKFFLLREDGALVDTEYTGLDDNGLPNHDVNFNAFNIDMVYSWIFSPGSELSIGYKNAIIGSSSKLEPNIVDDISTTFDSPQSNSISIKVLYFIDYLSLKRKGRSQEL